VQVGLRCVCEHDWQLQSIRCRHRTGGGHAQALQEHASRGIRPCASSPEARCLKRMHACDAVGVTGWCTLLTPCGRRSAGAGEAGGAAPEGPWAAGSRPRRAARPRTASAQCSTSGVVKGGTGQAAVPARWCRHADCTLSSPAICRWRSTPQHLLQLRMRVAVSRVALAGVGWCAASPAAPAA